MFSGGVGVVVEMGLYGVTQGLGVKHMSRVRGRYDPTPEEDIYQQQSWQTQMESLKKRVIYHWENLSVWARQAYINRIADNMSSKAPEPTSEMAISEDNIVKKNLCPKAQL